jgi:WD40 repeat protein
MKRTFAAFGAFLFVLIVCSSARAAVVVSVAYNPLTFPASYLYSYNPISGAATSGFTTDSVGSEGIDTLAVTGNTIYCFNDTFGQESLVTVNGTTGLTIAGSGGNITASGNTLTASEGATFGPDGFLYASNNPSDETPSIFRINPNFTNGGTPSATVLTTATGSAVFGSIAFGSDGNLYIGGEGSSGGTIWKYNPTTNNLTTLFTAGDSASDFAFGPNGNFYIADDNVVSEYNLSGTFVSTFVTAGEGGAVGISSLAFAPNGDLYALAATTVDGPAQVMHYNGTTGAFIADIASLPNQAQVSGIAFVPEPTCLLPVVGGIGLLYRRRRQSVRMPA